MSNRHQPVSELLSLLVAALPHTFFADPKQVQPRKIDIHQDLCAVLPKRIKPYRMGRFLHWYANRPAYQRALLHGKGQIDLIGTVVDHDIPAALREQVRER